MVDLNLPDPLDPATDGTWGPPLNAAITDIADALAAAGVEFTVEGTELVVELEGGGETRLPLPPGPRGNVGPAGGTDAATAEWVEDGPLTSAALSAKFVDGIESPGDPIGLAVEASIAASDPIALTFAGQTAVAESNPLRISSRDLDARAQLLQDGRTKTVLWTGGTDQTIVSTNCTVTAETSKVKTGTQASRITTSAAVTCTAYAAPIFPGPAPDPLTFPPASLVCSWVWVEDPSKVSRIEIEIANEIPTPAWIRGTHAAEQPGLTRGWNLIRHKATVSTLTGWGSAKRIRVIAITTAATTFVVDSIWVESTPKAGLLFIEDRGYKTFVDNGLPDLRARNIPVTWALDPMTHGLNVGTKNEVITDAQVATFYAAGDDISIHSYTGGVTSTLTPDEIRTDTLKSLKWLYDRGYTRGRQWRAAWTQNLATNAAAARPYYAAYATPSGSSALETWPFLAPFNIARQGIHGRSTTYMDQQFAQLKATNGLFVCYTHGIHADGLTNGADMTPTEWAYFLSKIDIGISEGWLEGVTMSQLLDRSGGVYRS